MVETFTPEGAEEAGVPRADSFMPEEAIAIALFVLGNLLAGIQVFVRGAFNIGIVWGQEMIVVLIIWSVFFGTSAVTARRRHVRMDIVAMMVPRKIAAGMETAASFFIMLYAAYVLIASWRFMLFLFESDEIDPSIEVPVWILFTGMPVAVIFLLIRSGGDLRLRARQLRYHL
ncbi:MAG: TRAP transporter small permease [Acetobacteraceae bacterium]